MRKKIICSLLTVVMLMSSISLMHVSANALTLGVSATEDVNTTLTKEIGPETDFTDMSLVTEEWATAHDWKATAGVYRKTVNNVGYELFYGWAPGEDYSTLDPHWQVTVIESPNTTGKIEILNNIDGFPVFSIANNAFSGNDKITEVIIHEGINSIGTSSFNLCINLNSVTLPSTLKKIGATGFYSTAITEVTIPENVTSIGNRAFYDVNKVTFEGNAPEIKYATFSTDSTIYVKPDATGFDVEPWTDFNIQVLRTSYELTPEKSTISVNESTQINYEVNADMIDKLTWTSSNEDVATVDEMGVVTGVGAGKATITLTDTNGITGTCEIEVIVPVEEIKISATEIPMKKHEKMDITVKVTPENADLKRLTWTSSNEDVVVIGENGTITAVGVGAATVSVSCDGASASFVVIVEPVEITSFEIIEKELFLDTGKTSAITIVIEPEDADATDLIWKSADETIVTVDKKGNVTGIGIGTTTITASYKDTTVSVEVIVKNNLKDAVISDIPVQKYTGEPIEPEIKVFLHTQPVSPENYDVTFENNVEEGTATVTVIGKDNYYGTVTTTFEIISDLPYEDVAETDWFYDAVYYTFVEGLMTGMDEKTFGPYGQLSRAQFALILHRMEGEAVTETNKSFTDISGDEWYGPAVMWAGEKVIVTGYQNGAFGPADMITREQMAVMMYRYANYKGYDVNGKADINTFIDAGSVSPFATDAMSWAYGKGIITGKENGTRLDPQGNTTRAEAAVIIQRFFDAYNEVSNNTSNSTLAEAHVHDWKEQYKEVDNGYWDKKVIKEAWTEYKEIYQTTYHDICNGCGLDVTEIIRANGFNLHAREQMLAGNTACGSYRTGEPRRTKVGTETIEHEAITEDVWIPKIEKVLTGYKCNSCGAVK